MTFERNDAELYANWFRCLADPTRLQILNLLAVQRRPMSVGEIVAAVGVGQSTVSEHLRRLAETRFVQVEHRGTNSYFEINRRCIECLPSAAELIMGNLPDRETLPLPIHGLTSRRPRAHASPTRAAAEALER